MTVYAAHPWRNNAELIVACHELGYIRHEHRVLDPTYGRGSFWRLWRPSSGLVFSDLRTDGVDFRALPWPAAAFNAVTFDPPYKLNGTATVAVDDRYGVAEYASHAARHQLIRDGITECARVLAPRGCLLVKCQDQVRGGKVRWQTREFADHGESLGLELVDMLHILGGRAQPEGRRQVHARRNFSTMLVLRGPK